MTAPAPATPSRRAQRRHDTRREILDAAWRLAQEEGIATLSLRGIARDLGMQAPSLYTYFPSKAAIFDAMFVQGYAEADEIYAAVVVDPADAVGTIERAIREFLQFCQASVPRYQLMFTHVVADWQPSAEAYAASVVSYQRMADAMAGLGIEGQRALDLWTALSGGLAAQQLANDPRGDRWLQLSRDAAEMFLNHIRRVQ